MSTTTDDGLEWIGDKTIGKRSGEIEEIAIGTGSGSEGTNASSLANEEYRGEVSDSNVNRSESNATGQFNIEVIVTGGLEVPGNIGITEIALFATDGTLIVIDEYDSEITVGAGEKRSFQMTFTPTR